MTCKKCRSDDVDVRFYQDDPMADAHCCNCDYEWQLYRDDAAREQKSLRKIPPPMRLTPEYQ